MSALRQSGSQRFQRQKKNSRRELQRRSISLDSFQPANPSPLRQSYTDLSDLNPAFGLEIPFKTNFDEHTAYPSVSAKTTIYYPIEPIAVKEARARIDATKASNLFKQLELDQRLLDEFKRINGENRDLLEDQLRSEKSKLKDKGIEPLPSLAEDPFELDFKEFNKTEISDRKLKADLIEPERSHQMNSSLSYRRISLQPSNNENNVQPAANSSQAHTKTSNPLLSPQAQPRTSDSEDKFSLGLKEYEAWLKVRRRNSELPQLLQPESDWQNFLAKSIEDALNFSSHSNGSVSSPQSEPAFNWQDFAFEDIKPLRPSCPQPNRDSSAGYSKIHSEPKSKERNAHTQLFQPFKTKGSRRDSESRPQRSSVPPLHIDTTEKEKLRNDTFSKPLLSIDTNLQGSQSQKDPGSLELNLPAASFDDIHIPVKTVTFDDNISYIPTAYDPISGLPHTLIPGSPGSSGSPSSSGSSSPQECCRQQAPPTSSKVIQATPTQGSSFNLPGPALTSAPSAIPKGRPPTHIRHSTPLLHPTPPSIPSPPPVHRPLRYHGRPRTLQHKPSIPDLFLPASHCATSGLHDPIPFPQRPDQDLRDTPSWIPGEFRYRNVHSKFLITSRWEDIL